MPVNSIKCGNCDRDDFDDFDDYQEHECVVDFDNDGSSPPKVAADGGLPPMAVWSRLTGFQRDILLVVADTPRYGLAVKRQLEEWYSTEINHGRLYPNLDTLVEKGLIEKRPLDKRTNEYAATDYGEDVVATARERDNHLDLPTAETGKRAAADGGEPE